MKVQLFGVKGDNVSPKASLQTQINDFIADKDVIDIKFQALKNYLPHTTASEYTEVMYAMVIYNEK